jgi:hypothetical protein
LPLPAVVPNTGVAYNAADESFTIIPTHAGTANITLTVHDAVGATASTRFTINVHTAPTLTAIAAQTATVGKDLTVFFSADQGSPPLAFSVKRSAAGLLTLAAHLCGPFPCLCSQFGHDAAPAERDGGQSDAARHVAGSHPHQRTRSAFLRCGFSTSSHVDWRLPLCLSRAQRR